MANLAVGGIGIFSGVPCSYITPMINEDIESLQANFVNAVNQGDAVAVAAGAWLGGRLGVRLRRYRRRWKIERTFAWLGNFRRLVVRWDRLITVYRSFFHLACLIITLRQLLNQF